VIAIEIQLLLDRFEAVLVEGRQVPLTSGVVVDRDRCFDLINQMRVSIPEEVKKAKRLHQERERVIAQANEEAERIVALAREQAAALVREHEVLQQAEVHAQEVLNQVKDEAQAVRAGADDYALVVLQQLEERLLQQLGIVRNGISTLSPLEPDPGAREDADE
jgi:nitrogen-specific signal transduction histidine kinase